MEAIFTKRTYYVEENTGPERSAGAGEEIDFLICQDSTGSRTFVWPTNVKGGMTIGSTASKCSAQAFAFDGSSAYATSPGVTNM